jgi:hypothetical protein
VKTFPLKQKNFEALKFPLGQYRGLIVWDWVGWDWLAFLGNYCCQLGY